MSQTHFGSELAGQWWNIDFIELRFVSKSFISLGNVLLVAIDSTYIIFQNKSAFYFCWQFFDQARPALLATLLQAALLLWVIYDRTSILSDSLLLNFFIFSPSFSCLVSICIFFSLLLPHLHADFGHNKLVIDCFLYLLL